MQKLVVKPTQSRGLGVFAIEYIEKGDLIECCRVIVSPRGEISLLHSAGALRNYVIEWGDRLAMPTGYGPFYNHSYHPNAIHHKHLDLNEIHFHALVNILPFEEITFNYGGFPTYNEPLWFTVKDS